jgi:putative ABC transport system permease protein
MKFLPLILKNLRRHRRRNLLTLLSIAASIFLFSALISLTDIPALILRGNANSVRLVCHNKAGLAFPLPEGYERKIAGLPHVTDVNGWDYFAGIYRDVKDQFPNYAVDPDALNQLWPEWGIAPPLPGLNVKLPMSDLALVASLILACAIGVVSAIIPATAVAHRNIVEGLRHAG